MERKSNGILFIVSAPSGAGKTTLCRRILSSVVNIAPSVSFTTREPRRGEANDVDYTFVSRVEFEEMAGRGDFVEWAEVHGNLYGTSRRRIEEILASGRDVLLDIDTQGARRIRETFGNGVFLFILPPSMKELRARLESRMSNTREDMERRLRRAAEEIGAYGMYDYVIVNDKVERSQRELESIVSAERLRTSRVDPGWIEEILTRR